MVGRSLFFYTVQVSKITNSCQKDTAQIVTLIRQQKNVPNSLNVKMAYHLTEFITTWCNFTYSYLIS